MYWFMVDETNLDPSQGPFLIYGGLIMTPEQLKLAHDAIEKIRADFGYQDNDQLKFQTASRPAQMSIPNWRDSKAAVMQAAVDIGIDMMVYVVHHGIAANQTPDNRMEWAMNSILTKFGMSYLAEKNDFGVVCVDRLELKTGYDYLRRRFQEPLDLPDGRSPKLTRILHYSMSADGASHVSSMVDVALGSFRFCANAAMSQGNQDVALVLFPKVAHLLWGYDKAGVKQIGGYGYLAFPKTVYSASFKADYEQLAANLKIYAEADVTDNT